MAKLRGVGYGLTVEKARQDAIEHIKNANGSYFESKVAWGEAEIEIDFVIDLTYGPETYISLVRQEYTYDG